jgi:LPXTG-site transpeptidase (sortase) family protein
MRLPKSLLKRSLMLVCLATLAFSFASPILDNSVAPITNSPAFYQQAAVKQSRVDVGLPMRLTIPRINTDAYIEPVGLTTNGEMATAKNPSVTAWYKSGPRPGDNGSSVIDGHFGIVNGKPAVFDNLSKLRMGDKLYVKDERGVVITFVVRELQTYNSNDSAKEVFVSTDGKAHLNLITCAGRWDKATSNYSNRTVVFTDKE